MAFKAGDKVRLAGMQYTGTVESVDGEFVMVNWDDQASHGFAPKCAASALEPDTEKERK
jgi:hypothetical protein